MPLSLASPPKAGSELLLGVRPEHFEPAGAVTLPIDIDLIEHLGGSSFAYARSGTDHPLIVEVRDRRQLNSGQRLDISFHAERALLFDVETGDRLR